MSRNVLREKKLAVLESVKKERNILFGSYDKNGVTKEEKEEAWLKILKKAQIVGLASAHRHWTYARDHLFGLWKSRTLAKRDSRKFRTGKLVAFNEVDDAILDILRSETPVVEEQEQGPDIPDVIPAEVQSSQLHSQSMSSRKRVLQKKRTLKRKLDHEDIRKSILESEFHINKLKIYELEKKLGLPPSRFTKEFENALEQVEVEVNCKFESPE